MVRIDKKQGRAYGRELRAEEPPCKYVIQSRHCFPGLNALLRDLFSLLSELPVPLAGQFVSPPVRTAASGHAWVSVDKQCHLHYEIIVAGLSKADDLTVNAHLHGLAEIGEIDDSRNVHRRLLTGFYGSQVHHTTDMYARIHAF